MHWSYATYLLNYQV